jgi:hypothetical protein
MENKSKMKEIIDEQCSELIKQGIKFNRLLKVIIVLLVLVIVLVISLLI